ncbi:MAG: hypothetical protein ACF787_11630, partial [Rhodopirellula sp. JB053]
MRPSVATDPCSWLSIGLVAVLVVFSVPAWVIAIVASLAIFILARRSASRDAIAIRKIQTVESDSRDAAAKARRELKSLEAQSRLGASALLQLIDGVVVLSSELSILLINQSAVRLL